MVADESEELGDVWWVDDALRSRAGELRYGVVVVFCAMVS